MGLSALDFAQQEIEELKRQGVYRPLRVLTSAQGPRAEIDGRRVINLSSNDYLGLANDPRLKRAAIEATERYGAGTAAVRTIIGTLDMHLELERRLAAFKGTEAAIVFQSGFTCNSGVIPVLVGEGDVIISDALNHASIIDGCRLSKAEIRRYAHKDMAELEAQLQAAQGFRRRLVITDGVFSMDGDIGPLPEIVRLCEQYGAISYVDDAHSSGVLGENGQGSVHHFGLQGRVDVQVGTLSKAVGVLGGYVATSRALVDLLIHRGRPFLFSTSHPPAVTAAAIEAINIMEHEPELIARLWANARRFKEGLNALGFNTGKSETPITPVIIGGEREAMQFSDDLFQLGVFAQGIAFPTVARGQARVRTIVSAAHSEEDLAEALAAFERAGRAIGAI
jgi:glycine C-acetyltransferase